MIATEISRLEEILLEDVPSVDAAVEVVLAPASSSALVLLPEVRLENASPEASLVEVEPPAAAPPALFSA